MKMSFAGVVFTLYLSAAPASGFFVFENRISSALQQSQLLSKGSNLFAGKGFGKSSSNGGRKKAKFDKTYGQEATGAINNVIDMEGAMSAFFSSNEEWAPLFRSFAAGPSVPAMSFITGDEEDFEFTENSKPWRRLDAIPSKDDDREILATFMDSCQKSLVDIPVNEKVEEDANDMHFIEEGRRILAMSRFHVLSEMKEGDIGSYNLLFSTCWNELTELRQQNEENTGSLILLPQYNLSDLRRFTDMNVVRPLEWLGVEADFEVTSLERGSPAIRILHKLQDIPTDLPKQPVKLDEA